MKICFIGKSGHSARAFREMKEHPEAEFVGYAPGSAEESTEPFRGYEGKIYASYEEMLRTEKPDVAVISPVFGLTASILCRVAAMGIDILAEKPVAGSLEELAAVEKAVRENNIRFAAMHFLRFTPSFYEAAEKVRAGRIGKVRMLNAQKSYRFGNRPTWYQNRELYTGTIPWVGIHAIDWIYHFADAPFQRVTALHRGDPEMTALCQFEMEGGILASANLDYYRPKGAKTHGDDRIRVVGEEGIIEVFEDRYLVIDGEKTEEFTPTEAPLLALEFLKGRDLIPLEEILMLTRISLLARASADEHQTKEVSP
ncbi:MAG: Gfo/Idh/MocA family oxidoreductase [Clostridia bacterium]|nr:Gfo/Idh/MocA family oxidoreductase [Clostridia bacterium]